MKNRTRQRENHRLKYLAQRIGQDAIEKPWLNSEGYPDPTAYQAIRNLERRAAMPKTSK